MVLHYEDPSLLYLSQGLKDLASPLANVLNNNRIKRREEGIANTLSNYFNSGNDQGSLLQTILSTQGAPEYVMKNLPLFSSHLEQQAKQAYNKPHPLYEVILQNILGKPNPLQGQPSVLSESLEENLPSNLELSEENRENNVLNNALNNDLNRGLDTSLENVLDNSLNSSLDPNQLSSNELEALEYIYNNAGKLDPKLIDLALLSGDDTLKEWAKKEQEKHNEYVKRSFEINKPLYEGIEKSRENLFKHGISLARLEDAIQSGNFSRWYNSLAANLGLNAAKTSKAQILESAVKDLFLSDLAQLSGGRINQFLEKNLLSALPNIGNSPIANTEITATLSALHSIKKEKIRLLDEMVEKYDSQGKELPRSTLR